MSDGLNTVVSEGSLETQVLTQPQNEELAEVGSDGSCETQQMALQLSVPRFSFKAQMQWAHGGEALDPKGQWLSTFLMPSPFKTVPHLVVTPNHSYFRCYFVSVILLLLVM